MCLECLFYRGVETRKRRTRQIEQSGKMGEEDLYEGGIGSFFFQSGFQAGQAFATKGGGFKVRAKPDVSSVLLIVRT